VLDEADFGAVSLFRNSAMLSQQYMPSIVTELNSGATSLRGDSQQFDWSDWSAKAS
jgi:hypothetical protein